jgi:hypothetical protein
VAKKIVILGFCLIFFNLASALNFGTLVPKNFEEAYINQTLSFKIFFYTLGNESYNLKISITQKPEDWKVLVIPSNFILNNSFESEEVLYTNERGIPLFPVNVTIKTSSSNQSLNSIILEARLENEAEGIKVIPAQLIELKIKLLNFSSTQTTLTIETQPEKHFDWFLILAVLFILMISLLIYKYG